ncbi:MAG TPA: LysR family transcriptional regulator [Candidatus Methylomirabilis sp.]|nr:LysR family transcriptional regulator [Candidatus Methylomirabilis sp.]
MNLAHLDLNLLVALESLLDEGSVGRAADRVALSQPAMSHALKRLRVLLDDPLLVRVGPRMQLTVRGEALRYPVKDVLSRVRDVLDGQMFDPARSTRTFRLFVADNAADLLLPALLKRLQKEAPSVSIQLQPGPGNSLDPLELAREVDVAIACVPNVFKGFYQQRLFTDRDACALRRGHPLAKHMEVESFLRARHVAVVGREFREDPVDTWLREEGRERIVALTVPHYLQALHVVARSDLIAVIPERLIGAHNSVLNLVSVAVPLDAGTFDEYLLHPPRSHTDAGCQWLRGMLKEIGTSLGPLAPQPTRRVGTRRPTKRTHSAPSRRRLER